MSKFKAAAFIIIFLILILITGCRERIIETSEIPDITQPSEELAVNTETTEEIIAEPTTIPEPATEYTEPPTTSAPTESVTTSPPTTAPETTTPPTTEPATLPPTEPVIETEPPTTAAPNLIIEIVEKATEIIQIPKEDITNKETIGNAESTESTQNSTLPEISSDSEEIITIPNEIPEEKAETVLSDDGIGTIGIIVDQYADFLTTSLLTLYECQRYYIYYEGINEYQTINRASDEHKIIIEASAFNVGEKLKDDALTVTPDWVLRKNPSMIIKCVGSDTLGVNITDATAAKSTVEDIRNRPDWDKIGAVMSKNIILVSEELLSSKDGQLLMKLYIASVMYPELFTGVEISDFCLQIKEAGGNDYSTGMFFYSMPE